MGLIRSFMFHDVRDISDTEYPNRYKLKSFIDRNRFESIIDHLSNEYIIISSNDINHIDIRDNNKYAILTFDDGLADHYYVYNHLKSRGISGTFLVPSSPVLYNHVMNTHKIQFILSSIDEKKLTREILYNFSSKGDIWEKYSSTKWKDNWWSVDMIFITNFLRHHNDNFDNYKYTNYLFNKYVTDNEEEFAKDFYLNTHQIEEMSNSGMIIGGHGHISENLLSIDNVDIDIKNSYNFIKTYSDNFIFSYPNGGFNKSIKDIMKKYNCELSYTTVPMSITDMDDVDYLEFPRYDGPQKIII